MAVELKDSGERRSFDTGAVRDTADEKGRFDLIQVHGILLSALQLERGAKKYGVRNWEKGMPISVFVNSATRHLLKFVAGYDDEPHLDAAIWNLLCAAEGLNRIRHGIWKPELDDLPKTYAGKSPGF